MKLSIKQIIFLATLVLVILLTLVLRAFGAFPLSANDGSASSSSAEVEVSRSFDDEISSDSKTDNRFSAETVSPAGNFQTDSQSALPEHEQVIEDNYKASPQLLAELKGELGKALEACRPIYQNADIGTSLNAVLSSADQRSLIRAIADQGYAAVDYYQTSAMQGYEHLVPFCEKIESPASGDLRGTFYFVFTDGQISQYTLLREAGVWHLITLTATWNRERQPVIGSDAAFPITGIAYSAKGRLMFQRSLTALDDLQQANSASWILIKVTPANGDMSALCARYIEPIGYFENNLFTTNWGPGYMTPIDFNSLYAYLFKMYTGTEALTSYNVYSYYKPVGDTGMYLIPTENFERVVDNFFSIDHSVLRAISDYSSADGGYYFLGYRLDYYSVTPRTPVPEVVDYWYNDDGTLTMRVDAVSKWYGTDRIFSHELTVAVEKNGDFKYISNTLYTDENSILPENILSTLLSARLDVYLDKK